MTRVICRWKKSKWWWIKMGKRIIAVVLMLMTVLLAVSCSESPEKAETEPRQIGYLCENGIAKYDIVIPFNAGEAVKNAAEELTDYVYQATGARLSVKLDTEISSGSPYISLGETSQLQDEALSIDYAALGSDGFVLKTVQGNYYIIAQTERGVLYGAYDFLEKVIGIKFIAYDYTYVPQTPTVALYETDDVQIPAIQNRCYLSNQLMHNREFAAHMRMTNEYIAQEEKYGGDIGIFREIDAVHNTLDYVTDAYYAQHPDWYFVYGEGESAEIYDIHFSNVGLNEDGTIDDSLEISPVKVAIANIKRYIQESDSTIFMIGQEDRTITCECSECKRQEAKFGRSGMIIRFVNAIVREVEAWMEEEGIERDIRFATFAYYYSQTAPVDTQLQPLDPSVVPHEKLYIRLAPITAYNYYGLQDENQSIVIQNMMTGWTALTDRVMIWTYHTAYSGYLCYYPTMQHWEEDLRLYAEQDALYVLMQSAYQVNAIWINHMETYVASKMMWNPQLNVEDLKREFISYYYAGIEEYVIEFMDILDTHYATFMAPGGVDASLRPITTIGGADSLMNPQLYSVNFWENIFDILDQADNKIETLDISEEEKTDLHDRVAMIRLTPQYMVMMKYDMYYPDDPFGKFEFYDAFFASCAKYDIQYVTEAQTIDGLKFNLGYTG